MKIILSRGSTNISCFVCNVFGALAKNGSFGFVEGWIAGRSKPNPDFVGQVVPLVRWQKLLTYSYIFMVFVNAPHFIFCGVGCFNFFIALACVSACQANVSRSRVVVMYISNCQNSFSYCLV
jgi:hypothetical protein